MRLGRIKRDLYTDTCEIMLTDGWIKCHNISTAKQLLKGEIMKLKTRENVRNTRYGRGYTSAEVAIMIVANLSGLTHDDVSIMTEDCNAKQINPSTFELNGRKMHIFLRSSLSPSVVTCLRNFREDPVSNFIVIW